MVAPPAGAAGYYELIETKTVVGTSTGTLSFTFTNALDTITPMYYNYQGGADASVDLRMRAGDTAHGGVFNSTGEYDQALTINASGTTTGSSRTGDREWDVAQHPAADNDQGLTGFGYVTTVINDADDAFLFISNYATNTLYCSAFAGKITTTTDGTLKYFDFYNSSAFMPDTTISCYKLARA